MRDILPEGGGMAKAEFWAGCRPENDTQGLGVARYAE